MRSMSQRMLHAAQNKDLPSEQLRAVVALRQQCDRWELDAVRRLRATGTSWPDIGAILGVSHQAARKRFHRQGIR